MQAGIIQLSVSPYFSPVLLVKNVMEVGAFVWIVMKGAPKAQAPPLPLKTPRFR